MREYLYSLATDKKKGFIAGIFKIFLFTLSLIFGIVVRVLSFICRLRSYRLNCRVISVGNITLGGTGKTSLVEMLALNLKEQGRNVAVLSRGYKRLDARCSMLDARYETMGDEPYMLTRNLGDIPVIVDKDRIRAGKKAIRSNGADAVILDDGFQQWRIKKDLEIVTIDATNPFGNLHLLPRGILREPLSSLKRADIFVLTKVNLNPDTQDIKEFLKRINPKALIVEAIHNPVGFYRLGDRRDNLLSPAEFKGKKVSLVCGIADPQSFENLISSLGIGIELSLRFPDHHNYTQNDLKEVAHKSQEKNTETIITTEKDAVRFYGLRITDYGLRVFVLRIKLEIIQYETFFNRIHSLF
jgi:tetraacyldisaccharide 4'-kinase